MNTLTKAAMYDQVQQDKEELLELIGMIPVPTERTHLWHELLSVAKEKYYRVKEVHAKTLSQELSGVRTLEDIQAIGVRRGYSDIWAEQLYKSMVERGILYPAPPKPFVTPETAQAIANELGAASQAAAEISTMDVVEHFGRQPHHVEEKPNALQPEMSTKQIQERHESQEFMIHSLQGQLDKLIDKSKEQKNRIAELEDESRRLRSHRDGLSASLDKCHSKLRQIRELLG
jgi:hypothetical protein